MINTADIKGRRSICLIICFFGKLPPYADCVLRSCQLNPDIDWLIFTDDQTPRNFPPNVHVKNTTLAELQGLFSAKVGFAVNLSAPRLLCQFRPAYGFFFEDVLKGYDFWGHCDFDMIFGDLRKFLREDILSAYDKILNRGHLAVYRNTPTVNRYFMLEAPGCPSYREVFASKDTNPVGFDEWRGIYSILRYHNIPQFHDEFIADIVPPTALTIARFEGNAFRNYPKQVFYWYKGKLFHAHPNCDKCIVDDEYAYIHFQKRSLPAPQFNPFAADGFFITPDGFFPYNREPLTDDDFAKYNRERWRTCHEILGSAWRRLKRRLGLGRAV
jgi:hypothetical protein